MTSTPAPRTLYQKIWDAHVVQQRDDGTALLYIDRHLVHEVTSPQAFDGLRRRRPHGPPADLTLAVPDHNIPTTARADAQGAPVNRRSAVGRPLDALRRNAPAFGIELFDDLAAEQGIVHVVGPGAGLHPSRHHRRLRRQPHRQPRRARRLGFGIGTSEVEMCSRRRHCCSSAQVAWKYGSKATSVPAHPKDRPGDRRQDRGRRRGLRHPIYRRGVPRNVDRRATDSLQHVDRGGRPRGFAPDEKTFSYLQGKPWSPRGAEWDQRGSRLACARERSGRRVRQGRDVMRRRSRRR